jgi:serine protease Do
MKRFFYVLLGLFFSLCAFATTQPNSDNSIAPMLKKIMPSVVNIAAQGEMVVPTSKDESDDSSSNSPRMPYNGGTLRDFASLGSGVIVDAAKGYVITNNHVIDKAKTITVTLSDGRNFKAKLIGTDPSTDVAILQIPAEKLEAMPIGNSDSLQVGDFVAAVGSPFGLNQTVTSGIVSALERGSLGIEGPQGLESFIQTDASINPGNSGGALIDLHGQLIGINTAILTPEGGNIGIGFAIPINMAKTIMSQLIQYGSVKRGLMGVVVQDLTPALAKGFDLKDAKGAIITLVSPNSPAQKAELQAGDVIISVNGQTMETASAVRNTVGLLRVGAKINLTVLRKGKKMNMEVVTADPDKYMENSQTKNPFLFGLALRDFDQQTPAQGHVTGVQITFVSKNSAAWRAGLIPGDVVTSANQMPIKSIHELQNIASGTQKVLLLNIARGNGALFIAVEQ